MILIPGKKLCPKCRQKLYKDIKEQDRQGEEQVSDFMESSEDEEISELHKSVSLDQERSDVSGFFDALDISPLKMHAQSSSGKLKQGKRKLESVVATVREKVARSLNVASDELKDNPASSDAETLSKAASFDEMMNRLADKVKSLDNRREKLQILTLVPSNWSNKQASDFFGVSEYYIRTARKIAIEKGILSLPDPKRGRNLSQITVDLVHHLITTKNSQDKCLV